MGYKEENASERRRQLPDRRISGSFQFDMFTRGIPIIDDAATLRASTNVSHPSIVGTSAPWKSRASLTRLFA